MQDLNNLSLFAAVVENGGFSAASRALNVPKSRISRRISALEEELGIRLIERSTRGFHVTEAGKDVYEHARAVVAESVSVEEIASRLKAEPQGLVRISCPQGIDRMLNAALPTFLLDHPKIRVQLIVTNRRVDLIEEGIDVAVRIRDRLDSDADFQVRIVGKSEARLFASPHFVSLHGVPETPEQIPNFQTIARTERQGQEKWILRDVHGTEKVVVHQPRFSASHFDVLTHAAVAGIGIALLPDPVTAELVRHGKLQMVLPEWRTPQGIIHIIFTSRRGLLPSVRAVIDFLADVMNPDHPTWQQPLDVTETPSEPSRPPSR